MAIDDSTVSSVHWTGIAGAGADELRRHPDVSKRRVTVEHVEEQDATPHVDESHGARLSSNGDHIGGLVPEPEALFAAASLLPLRWHEDGLGGPDVPLG